MSLIAAEVLLWQDFRYEKGLADRLNFGQILNMVGGEVVSVGLPMNGPGSVNSVDVTVRLSNQSLKIKYKMKMNLQVLIS